MPVLNDLDYAPSGPFKNGHINTLFPFLFRKRPTLKYYRQRFTTPDDDFADVDWLRANNKRLAVLLHGLEGSSNSQYILGTSKLLHDNHYDVAAINFRTCSGEINRQICMYHSGFTEDLHFIIESVKEQYDEIFIAGFSLGGNVAIKYVSDKKYTLSAKVKSVTGISVPCDLDAGSDKIMKKENYLYEKNFIQTLSNKIRSKHSLFPDKIEINDLKKVKTLRDFDEYFTAPMHGFLDAADYYARSNCLQFLSNIDIPCLIINALDDSFLPDSSYPYSEAEKNPFLFLMTPKHGGHVGFTTFGSEFYWNEIMMLNFFNTNSLLFT